ncbi:MAG: tRNA-dihydrouridine synthase family protein [Nannocystaceae bacterium]
MDGVTDHIQRRVIASVNGTCGVSAISLCVSEFVRVTGGVVPDAVLSRHCPELATQGRTVGGVPVFVQLLGSDPAAMAGTAKRAIELGAPGIDLNFGCPAKTVNRHDGGASLLKTPSRVGKITAAVRRAVPLPFPVSVKIRVGWDSSDHVVALAHAVADGGGDWLTIHGRTRTQQYRPPVDWAAIGQAADAIEIPVVANGDLFTPAQLHACARASGCRAFMAGRGVMAAPNWFRWARGYDGNAPNLAAHSDTLAKFVVQSRLAAVADPRILRRVKQWMRMAADIRPELAPVFNAMKRLSRLPDAMAVLRRAGRD